MDWYHAQMASKEPTVEKWPSDNTYVNHWKVDTTMLFAPGRVHNVSGIGSIFGARSLFLHDCSVLPFAVATQP